MVPTEILIPVISVPFVVLGTVLTLHGFLKKDFNGKMTVWSNELTSKVDRETCHATSNNIIDKIGGVERQVTDIKQAQIITQSDVKEILRGMNKLNGK